MEKLFIAKGLLKDGKLKTVAQGLIRKVVLRRIHEVAGTISTKDEFIARFDHSNCPLYNIPKNKCGCHHLSRCPWLKYIGLDMSDVKYDYLKDERHLSEKREDRKNKLTTGKQKDEEDEDFSALGNDDDGGNDSNDGGRDNDGGGRGGGRGDRGSGQGRGGGRGRSVSLCTLTPSTSTINNDAPLDNVVGKDGKDTKNDEDAMQAIQNNLQK